MFIVSLTLLCFGTGRNNTLLGKGKSGNCPCPFWEGPQHFPFEDFSGRAILQDSVTKIDRESRPAILVQHLAGSPLRKMQHFAPSLIIIQESSCASGGVARFRGLSGREFRAAAYYGEYADVAAFVEIRRTEADLGSNVARLNFGKERAFQPCDGSLDESASKQVASIFIRRVRTTQIQNAPWDRFGAI